MRHVATAKRWAVPLAVLAHDAARAAAVDKTSPLSGLPAFDPAEHESGWHRIFTEGPVDYVSMTYGPKGFVESIQTDERDSSWMDSMVEAFTRYTASGFVPAADYNHSLHSGGTGHEDNIRAGDVLELRHEDAALWARIRWTKRAREYMSSGEYRYLSPTIGYDVHTAGGEDFKELVVSVALCNDPRLHDIGSVTDGLAAFTAALWRAHMATEIMAHQEAEMGKHMEALERIEARLGKIEAVLTALQLAVEDAEAGEEKAESDAAKGQEGEVQTLRAQVVTLQGQVRQYAAERDQTALQAHAQKLGLPGEVLTFAEGIRAAQGLEPARKALELYARRSPADFSRSPAGVGVPAPESGIMRITHAAVHTRMEAMKVSGSGGYARAVEEMLREASARGLTVTYDEAPGGAQG